MDERTIRIRLEEARRELGSLAERRDALIGLVTSYEVLLRLESATAQAPFAQMPLPANGATVARAKVGRSTPKGKISLSKAIVAVLKDAHGAPLKTNEILTRILAMGAVSEAKNPQGAVDLVCHYLSQHGKGPVKVGPRTWEWREPPVELHKLPTVR